MGAMLPHVMRFNMLGSSAKFADIAVGSGGLSQEKEAPVEGALAWFIRESFFSGNGLTSMVERNSYWRDFYGLSSQPFF